MEDGINLIIRKVKEGEPLPIDEIEKMGEKARIEGHVFKLEHSQKFEGVAKVPGCEVRTAIPMTMAPQMWFQVGVFEAGTKWSEHWHALSEEIWIVAKGKGKLRLASLDGKIERHYTIETGDVVYVPPRIVHSFEADMEEEMVFIGAATPPDLSAYRALGLWKDEVTEGPYPWKDLKVEAKK